MTAENDENEKPLSEPFWSDDFNLDTIAIDRYFRQRFPVSYAILAESLEEADPMDVVYPGNPNEYSDVVIEVIVLLAYVNADLTKPSSEKIDEVVRDGLARRFGELPDEDRVRRAVVLIAAKSSAMSAE
jgi:hypothetical protein